MVELLLDLRAASLALQAGRPGYQGSGQGPALPLAKPGHWSLLETLAPVVGSAQAPVLSWLSEDLAMETVPFLAMVLCLSLM